MTDVAATKQVVAPNTRPKNLRFMFLKFPLNVQIACHDPLMGSLTSIRSYLKQTSHFVRWAIVLLY